MIIQKLSNGTYRIKDATIRQEPVRNQVHKKFQDLSSFLMKWNDKESARSVLALMRNLGY